MVHQPFISFFPLKKKLKIKREMSTDRPFVLLRTHIPISIMLTLLIMSQDFNTSPTKVSSVLFNVLPFFIN